MSSMIISNWTIKKQIGRIKIKHNIEEDRRINGSNGQNVVGTVEHTQQATNRHHQEQKCQHKKWKIILLMIMISMITNYSSISYKISKIMN